MKLPVNLSTNLVYENIFQDEYHKRIDFISKYSKDALLKILSSINNHPKRSLFFHNISWEFQMDILSRLFKNNNLDFVKFISLLDKFKRNNANRPIGIFNRSSNVIAINEILESEEIVIDGKDDVDTLDFLKYYLSVNSFTLIYSEKRIKEIDSIIDILFPYAAATNEHQLPCIPFLELYRGIHLIDYFESDEELADEFSLYFKNIGFDPQIYYPIIFSYIIPLAERTEMFTPIFEPKSKFELEVLKSLSIDTTKKEKNELLTLRRKSFYRLQDENWLLLDLPFLIDNTFYFTINSFWFNHLKDKGYSAKLYFSRIGRFYEKYITKILQHSFSFLKHPAPKVLDELIVKSSKGNKELSDCYIRANKKVLLVEIKSKNYPSKFKYSSDPIKSFESKREFIKKEFGLKQIAQSVFEYCINPVQFDKKTDIKKRYTLFPILILNDKIFQLPYANYSFHKLFMECLNDIKPIENMPEEICSPFKIGSNEIYPLTIFHTSDLELMEEGLMKKEIDIFKLIKCHCKVEKLHNSFGITMRKSVSTNFADFGLKKIKPYLQKYNEKKKTVDNSS